MQILEQKKFPARMESLYPSLDSVISCAESQGVAPGRIGDIRLSLEELLVNVFNYAYEKDDPAAEVEIACGTSASGDFVIEVADRGRPFDILAREAPLLDLEIGDRQVGGLGIHLVKQLMDEVGYERQGGRNKVTLKIGKQERENR